MTLSNETRAFLDSQIEYYNMESQSYKEMAKEYKSDNGSVPDTTYGIIIGCIYSSFLQIYTNQNSAPNSQEMEEFTEIIVKNSKKIKESIVRDDAKAE